MARLVFHIDVNSAFLSWEAARRVAAGEPDLRLVPSAIGGDRNKRTGVILAKSVPAKKYGIRTGEPVGMALRKCPELVLVPSDFRLYVQNSKAFMDICRRYAPVVEKYSIDECFLDMSGTEYIYPDPVALAYEIKDTIHRELGFTVNVGVAGNKLLAKMAGDLEKPDRVHTMFPGEIRSKMWPLPVRDLFTVGASTAHRLEQAGIMTIGQLAQTELSRVQRLVGEKQGLQIHRFANGIDDTPVSDVPEEAKGFSISTTLEEDVTGRTEACRILLTLADTVSARMRAETAKAWCIGVTIRSNDFRDRAHQRTLDAPTDITDEIYEVSCRLFDELWDRRTPLRLIGIALTQITREETEQLSLFDSPDRERARKRDRTVDVLRGKFGPETIRRGTALEQPMNAGQKYKAQLEQKKMSRIK